MLGGRLGGLSWAGRWARRIVLGGRLGATFKTGWEVGRERWDKAGPGVRQEKTAQEDASSYDHSAISLRYAQRAAASDGQATCLAVKWKRQAES